MTDLCEELPWDSEFFSRRIGRVRSRNLSDADGRAVVAWAAAHRIDCLYFLADPADSASMRVAAQCGFDLVDVRVTLEATTDGRTARERGPDEPVRIRAAVPDDVDALTRIARVSHRDSRFYRDGRFDPRRCDDLFAVWIEKSVRGYADVVLVAEVDRQVAGYVTGHRAADDRGTIGLLGIDASFRRLGSGAALVAGALDSLGRSGVARVGVVTQGCNAPALAFYQRVGFVVSAIELWYHRWTV